MFIFQNFLIDQVLRIRFPWREPPSYPLIVSKTTAGYATDFGSYSCGRTYLLILEHASGFLESENFLQWSEILKELMMDLNAMQIKCNSCGLSRMFDTLDLWKHVRASSELEKSTGEKFQKNLLFRKYVFALLLVVDKD